MHELKVHRCAGRYFIFVIDNKEKIKDNSGTMHEKKLESSQADDT